MSVRPEVRLGSILSQKSVASEDAKSDKAWATFELPDVGHMAILDASDRLSELILQAE